MGRKIDMKKIEDVTKCQVTFSKRRSSLMKKANEISVCCDVDVAFVAFSPSGRVSKFSNQKRIEDVLQRYVNLPADKRLHDMNNVQEKMEKLKQLSHINGETSKLHFLDKQIENLELQIKKTSLELQILETDLRDYEIGQDQEASLHQLSWCERNLNHSLQRVIARKMQQVELENQPLNTSIPSCSNHNEQVLATENPNPNPISGELLMQLDPWISPYSAKVRESIFQGIIDQAKEPRDETVWQNQSVPYSNMSKAPIQESPLPYIPSQQHLMMDQPGVFNFQEQNNVNASKNQSLMMSQPFFNFHDQNNYTAYNPSSVVFSDAIHMSAQSSCSIQDPLRFGPTTTTTTINPSSLEMPQPFYGEMGSGFQTTNSNLMSQFSNMDGSQEIGNMNVSMCDTTTLFKANNTTANDTNIVELEDFRTINKDQIQVSYPQQGAYSGHDHHKESVQEAQIDHLLEENRDDNAMWSTLNGQKNNNSLWEWEDLLLDENFNFQNLP